MNDASQPQFKPAAYFRWTVWLAALGVYSYLLIIPNKWLPEFLRITVHRPITDEFTYGKVAHIASYALLTASTFALPVGWCGWLTCVATMSLHGFGTEFVQTFTGRHGCWFDVGIDHIGIATGLLLGGLGYWLFGSRPRGSGFQRVMPPPKMNQDRCGEDADAEPL